MSLLEWASNQLAHTIAYPGPVRSSFAIQEGFVVRKTPPPFKISNGVSALTYFPPSSLHKNISLPERALLPWRQAGIRDRKEKERVGARQERSDRGKKRKGGRKRDRDRTVLHMTAEKKILVVSFFPSQKACCYLARWLT